MSEILSRKDYDEAQECSDGMRDGVVMLPPRLIGNTIEALADALTLAVEAADATRGYIPAGSPIGNIIQGHYDLTDASLVELREKGWLSDD